MLQTYVFYGRRHKGVLLPQCRHLGPPLVYLTSLVGLVLGTGCAQDLLVVSPSE